ncbi:hypothetical protein L6452_20454 [Arctium lappa]|uniref:Uncharacterized protein n=1 Tax=Arctium lappa TaxID=4217 RepID=A0ACB9BAW8_ARCLA|nr:hypothetical protein L6452_20454 [Arctium lappa]
MADEEKEKLDSSLKDDDNENNSSPTSEIPMDDIPPEVKKEVKTELSKLLNDDQNNSARSSEIPVADIPAKLKMETTVKGELSKLLNDNQNNSSSSSEIPLLILDPNIRGPLQLRLSEESKRKILWKWNNRFNANEKPMLEVDDIPAKVKMEAASKSEMPDHNNSSSDNESGNVSDD